MTPRSDLRLALLLGALYAGLLLSTASSLGYARDEGFYFYAAQVYRDWFALLVEEPARALQRAEVDRYWAVNHEHPSLMKVLFAASHQLFCEKLAWLSPGTSYRLPSILLGGMAVALIHHWGARTYGRLAGLVAALGFGFMPRVFFHAHLACFDVPVAALWLFCAYSWLRSLEAPGTWAYRSALCFGLLLDTKHNAWLFPVVLALHTVLARALYPAAESRWGRPDLPKALVTMALGGPLLLYVLWPWLWHDPLNRFIEYVQFHTQHEYYNMEFLGQTYWKPPMPAGYAWLMTLATVPVTTLLLAAIGVGAWLGPLAKALLRKVPAPSPAESAGARPAPELLWCLALLVGYAPWWSPATPIFGGTKHWLTAYPFLALLAGRGFRLVALALERAGGERGFWNRLPLPALGAASVSLVSVVMALRVHPFGLSAYTPLVGGAAGAATLGLNRTFWGYTTGSLSDYIDRRAPQGSSIYVHDTALPSFDMLRADGRLREDLRGSLSIAGSNLALYHHEPHMSRVEHQIWMDYGSVTPSAMLTHDGVPVTWIYQRR